MRSANSNILIVILITVVLLMGGYIIFFSGNDKEYKDAEKRSDHIIDSVRARYSYLELRYDSLDQRARELERKDSVLVSSDVGVVVRVKKRNEEYEQIFLHIDTAGRDERYRINSGILANFQFIEE